MFGAEWSDAFHPEYRTRQEVFGDSRPAGTLDEVSRPAVFGAKVELEAVALIPLR